MKVIPTTLPGVILLELEAFHDARGSVVETFQRGRYTDAGIALGVDFVQDNVSSSVRGVLRGLHYQLARPQGKLIHVTRGEVFDVSVDIRVGSPSFGTWFSTVLSAENHHQLWIPAGFAHGFAVLSDIADVAYKITSPYVPSDARAIQWNDPDLAINWPLAEPILSAADAAAPRLRDAELPRYTS